MLPIRNISYLLPMCCSFWEKYKNSPKTGLGCSTPLSDQKVRVWKIIVKILCKSNSYVLYCLSDEKMRISKFILEILLKSNSYIFYYFKSMKSDEKVRIWVWHLFVRLYSARRGAKCKARNYVEPEFVDLLRLEGTVNNFRSIPIFYSWFIFKVKFLIQLKILKLHFQSQLLLKWLSLPWLFNLQFGTIHHHSSLFNFLLFYDKWGWGWCAEK